MPRHAHDGNISVYANVRSVKPLPDSDGTILKFLENVKSDLWKQETASARLAPKDSTLYKQIKQDLTAVTISGTFKTGRNDADLIEHSGFICMDFDALENVDEVKATLMQDPYSYAVFKSLSGIGLAVIVKITKSQAHRDLFQVLRHYYETTYHLSADPSCINVGRLRIASHDPECYINETSKTWSSVAGLSKINKPKPKSNLIATDQDFDNLIQQIVDQNIDVTNGYENWLYCGFAISEQFGEAGRQYFHTISQQNAQYDPQKCDKQYDHCLKSNNAHKITIGTFYYYCQQYGLQISSQSTREAVNVARFARAQNRSKDEVKKDIAHLELSEEAREDVVNQVFEAPLNAKYSENLTLAQRVELYLLYNYDLKRNTLYDQVESEGKAVDEDKINNFWLECLNYVGEKVSKQLVVACLSSPKIPNYNPIEQFFEQHQHLEQDGLIDQIAESIPCVTTIQGMDPTEYCRTFVKKWLVGMVAGVYGNPNTLVLCLVGKKINTGKTEFFRRFLPKELDRFRDEATLDSLNGRENAIKLAKNILIFDDEGDSKNYKEAKKFKALTSSKTIKVRKLYQSTEHEYNRIASLGMTSNELDIINDYTGNRRIVPIEIHSKINFELFNDVDKRALMMEAWRLYQRGYDYKLADQEIEGLSGQDMQAYQPIDLEVEYINSLGGPGALPCPCASLFYYLNNNLRGMSARMWAIKIKKAGLLTKPFRDNDNVVVKCYMVDDRFYQKITDFCQSHPEMRFTYEVGKLIRYVKPF